MTMNHPYLLLIHLCVEFPFFEIVILTVLQNSLSGATVNLNGPLNKY